MAAVWVVYSRSGGNLLSSNICREGCKLSELCSKRPVLTETETQTENTQTTPFRNLIQFVEGLEKMIEGLKKHECEYRE